MEYLKLFHAVCSEIDVLGKILASIVDTLFIPTKKTGINEWWYYLYNDDATIESKKCSLFGEHDLNPWKNFNVLRNTGRCKNSLPNDVKKCLTFALWGGKAYFVAGDKRYE